MKKSVKFSDIMPAKAIKWAKVNLNKPIKIGHLLAVMCYDKGEHLETLFIDQIDVCKSATVFIFNKDYFETLYFSVDYMNTYLWGAEVVYNNGAKIEIIRIS
jgi:hypothetical protein